ncbi:YNL058C [Saccharomyces arboricola H-6]|uniref:YNL058C n=1 Tax=Saccharomyces arboricola (strain H-6 / AS 2.3317 / CBS 10644) TaxID=1160507 RepID=J8LIR1_SACAR|nr:YNL058C [Saccharomyces arboricola H-6]
MVRKNFIPSVSLVRRDLPKLTTTTASSTTVSKSASTVASQTSSTSLPSLATSLSSSKSSSSSLVIPSITPPSTVGNPFILNAGKKPNGTVYIAVGAIIGAFFVCVFIWWLVSNYMARRSAMSTSYAIDSKSFYKGHHKHTSSLQSNPFDINDEKSYLHDDWDSMSQLEYSQYDDTVSPFNPVQDPFADNKSKLFISPTLQVSQYEKSHSRHQSKDTNIFIDDASLYTENYMGQEEEKKLNLNRPQRAASPERKERKINSMEGYHKRNQSSLGLIPVATATSNTSSPKKAHKRQTPSMFLDDVLNGKGTI